MCSLLYRRVVRHPMAPWTAAGAADATCPVLSHPLRSTSPPCQLQLGMCSHAAECQVLLSQHQIAQRLAHVSKRQRAASTLPADVKDPPNSLPACIAQVCSGHVIVKHQTVWGQQQGQTQLCQVTDSTAAVATIAVHHSWQLWSPCCAGTKRVCLHPCATCTSCLHHPHSLIRHGVPVASSRPAVEAGQTSELRERAY